MATMTSRTEFLVYPLLNVLDIFINVFELPSVWPLSLQMVKLRLD
jgi:hypothetical protein